MSSKEEVEKTEEVKKPQEGFFKLIKATSLDEFISGKQNELPESDLCFQHEGKIVQFEYMKPKEDEEKNIIEPGIFMLEQTSVGVKLRTLELRDRELLSSVTSTERITKEAKLFYSKLHIYEKLKRMKKRSVLIYSSPGMGKSSAIAKICNEFVKEDPGTVVMVWPTSAIDADTISHFLSVNSEYDSKCTRLIFIMEDIGGTERENNGMAAPVDSGLLNLLDGVGVTFSLPTFIVATTNHPENLLASLADRPGRFDLMMKLDPPTYQEKLALTAFIAKRDLTEEEKEALNNPKIKDFSIAHLEEIVVRSMLHDKTMGEVIKEMVEHTEKFNKGFSEKQDMGISFR
jgi:SpoVK/Ycf46/Vps4 family AAA+-type ATPase